MATDDLSRAKKKFIAIERAKRRLMNRLNDIDWEADELLPAVEDLEKRAAVGELPEFTIIKDED